MNGITRKHPRDPGAGLRRLSKEIGAEDAHVLLGSAQYFVGEIELLLSQPGRGRLRHGKKGAKGVVRRLGAGSYRWVKDADGKRRRKRVQKGVARTRIDTADRASAPGDPPAVDTGQLRNSIGYDVVGSTIRIGTNVSYAAALEFGSRGKGAIGAGFSRLVSAENAIAKGKYRAGIAPRPYMRPGLARATPEMTKLLRATLQQAARKQERAS